MSGFIKTKKRCILCKTREKRRKKFGISKWYVRKIFAVLVTIVTFGVVNTMGNTVEEAMKDFR